MLWDIPAFQQDFVNVDSCSSDSAFPLSLFCKKWHQVSALDWLKPFLEYSMQSCFTTSKNLEKSWLFSIDPFHHLQFTWFWSINHPCCRTPRTSNLGVSDPHEILRLKVPAVVAIPVLKNSRQRVQYVEMRKPHFHSTSFSTCQHVPDMTSKGRN